MSQFDMLLEKELERFQMGGFLIGDRVKFKKDALSVDYIAKRPQGFKDIIASCMEPSFDLNLRIGAIKSVYPTSATNFQAGNSTPDGVFADVYVEYAPGLYRNPMTVPVEVLEIMDDGAERGPIPNSSKRQNNIHGPKEQKATPNDVKTDVNLNGQNVQIPGANKWDDTKPGGGNF